jgi:hypothetical protein
MGSLNRSPICRMISQRALDGPQGSGTLFFVSGGDRIWNRLYPGWSIHVASLDQDDDESVELGLGVNASLWGGLPFGGVGYNLNADSDEYFFLGTDLFKILGALRTSIESGPSGPTGSE